MSYSFTAIGPSCSEVGGRRYLTWTIREGGVGSGAPETAGVPGEWAITGLPEHYTISLFEAAATDGNVKPELGLAAEWSSTSLDHVIHNHRDEMRVRNDCPIRVSSPGRKLFGRSNTTSEVAVTVTTRITIIEGH